LAIHSRLESIKTVDYTIKRYWEISKGGPLRMGQANGYQERSRRKSFALPYVRWRKTSI